MIEAITACAKKAATICRKIPKRKLGSEHPILLAQRLKKETGKFFDIPSINGSDDVYKVTMRDFDHTCNGDVFLYRGLADTVKEDVIETANLSVAATSSNPKEKLLSILQKNGYTKLNKKTKRALMGIYSGLTQGEDPVIHTSRSRRLSRDTFAKDGGTLITYKMKVKDLKRIGGVLGHKGEDEIDFFFKIPKKYVHRIEQIGKPARTSGKTWKVLPTPNTAPAQSPVTFFDFSALPLLPERNIYA